MIYALITLYKPDNEVVKNVKGICLQVDKTFLSDNSPKSNERMFCAINNCTYVYNGANLALSGAFNRILRNSSIDWSPNDFVIFFDQDSSIPDNHIKKLISEYQKLLCSGINVGCLGPIYYNRSINRIAIPKIKKKISPHDYIVKSIITSSMVSTYRNLEKIGFWNEEIFLDLADWDLCWRLRNQGMVCIETDVSILNHAVGSGVKKVGMINIAETNCMREYYQTRNYLYLLKKPYVPVKYKIEFIRNLTIRPLIHYIFLDSKNERKKYIKAGWLDYKRHYYGEYRDN